MKLTSTHYFIGLTVLVLVGIIGVRYYDNAKPGQYDTFAQCIQKSGATFYGAFWCPHCKEQKEMFGNSVQYLPYVECSLPSGQGQTAECIDKEIQTYPTWIFANGERISGTQSLETLSEKTGCPLVQDTK